MPVTSSGVQSASLMPSTSVDSTLPVPMDSSSQMPQVMNLGSNSQTIQAPPMMPSMSAQLPMADYGSMMGSGGLPMLGSGAVPMAPVVPQMPMLGSGAVPMAPVVPQMSMMGSGAVPMAPVVPQMSMMGSGAQMPMDSEIVGFNFDDTMVGASLYN
jgi:hypothetical protein